MVRVKKYVLMTAGSGRLPINITEFIVDNDLSREEIDASGRMKVTSRILYGGGAAAESTLLRVQ